MSNSVDNRVVTMTFDNAAFESKMKQTMTSLDALKKSLDFQASKKGLDQLSTAGKNFSMGNIGATIEGASTKFLTLATIGITALTRITNAAITTGIQMLKSLTLEPIMAGFGEYETKMGSIQTILANTARYGTSLGDVNKSLDQLNTYADKTIYSFGDMTKNIGLFTNAGLRVEDATQMIKGFSNVAAASGTNAEGAANAAYQLSQALSTGTVRLMDWRSLTNVGMGNKNMQDSLIQIADAMGVIKQKGTSAAAIQKDFNGSLQDGWLSADVMSKYLRIMAGEMSTTEMASLGLTKAQISGLQKQAKTAEEAATKVRTATQLISTVKEAVGSGWSETFQLLIGDFNQATDLFTNINNVVSGFVGKMSDARNNLLRGWAFAGGRIMLLESFKNIFRVIGELIKPIQQAFRDIFPPMTVARLYEMTKGFLEFTKGLKIGEETATHIRSVFRGLFSIFEIGAAVVKGFFSVIGDVFKALAPTGSGFLSMSANVGDMVTSFKNAVVDGGKIKNFFDQLGKVIVAPIKFLQQLATNIRNFFKDATSVGGDNRLTSRMDQLANAADSAGDAWDRFNDRMQGVKTALGKIWDYISNWFSELGQKIADAFKPGDFDAALDIINVGLLGGIVLLLKKMVSGGLKIDLGKGLVDSIKNTFDTLTNTLKSMQTQIKANALVKIATAVGILVASVVVLSMIDSAKLTKALTALTVSFGELIGAMTVIDKLNFTTSVAKLNGIAVAMGIMASAAVILSVAIKNLSSLGWEELAKGLIGVAGGLAILVGAVKLLGSDTGGLIAAGTGMIFISTALVILSEAVKSFADLGWEDMAQGLIGVGVGLAAVTLAMNNMPPSSVISGAGFIEIAVGLSLLAGAVKLFSLMGWAEMTKGLVGIGEGLVVVAGAMHLMPLNLPITAAGVLILAGALNIMAGAVKLMGSSDLVDIAKGVGALGAMLFILAGAVNAMNGAIPGAVAVGIVSASLVVLAHAIKVMGEMDTGEIVKGLISLAAAMVTLGLSALVLEPLIPAMMGLGVALAVVGGAFALFGVGAMLVAKSLEVLAKSGEAGINAFLGMLKAIGTALPELGTAVGLALAEMIDELLKAMPLMIRLFEAVLEQLLETVIKEIPKIAEALGVVITNFLELVREKSPDVVATGMQLLLDLLKGVRDNIEEVTKLVGEIITNFLDAFTEEVPRITESLANTVIAIFENTAYQVGRVSGRLLFSIGINFMQGFMDGLNEALPGVKGWFTSFPGKILSWIGNALLWLVQKGVDAIQGLLNGLNSIIGNVSSFFTSLPGKIVGWVGNALTWLVQKGVDAIQGLLNGITTAASTVWNWFTNLGTTITSKVANAITWLVQTGRNIISGLMNGIIEAIVGIAIFFGMLGSTIVGYIPDAFGILFDVGKNIIEGLWNGIWAMKDWFLDKLKNTLLSWIPGWAKKFLRIGSPSKIMEEVGRHIPEGLAVGIEKNIGTVKNAMEHLSNAVINGFNVSPNVVQIKDSLTRIIHHQLRDLDEFNPTITPVLDLTKVRSQANTIGKYLKVADIQADLSMAQARVLASTAVMSTESTATAAPVVTSITFEQINNSPKALSTTDIYRNTRSQLALAKQELGV